MTTSTSSANDVVQLGGLKKMEAAVDEVIGHLEKARASHRKVAEKLETLRNLVLNANLKELPRFFEDAGLLIKACQDAFDKGSEVNNALERCLQALVSLVAEAAQELARHQAQIQEQGIKHKKLKEDHERLEKKVEQQDQVIRLGQLSNALDRLASRFTYGNAFRQYGSFPRIKDSYVHGDLDENQQAGYLRFCDWLWTKGMEPNDLIERTSGLRDRRNAHGKVEDQRRVTDKELLQWASAQDEEELAQLDLEALEDSERAKLPTLKGDVQALLPLVDGLMEEEGHPLVLCPKKITALIKRCAAGARRQT